MDEKKKNGTSGSFRDQLMNYGDQKSMEQYEEELRLEKLREERRRRALANRKKKLEELLAAAENDEEDGNGSTSTVVERTSTGATEADEDDDTAVRKPGRKRKASSAESIADEVLEDSDDFDEETDEDSDEEYTRSNRAGAALRALVIIIVLLVVYAVFHAKCELKSVLVNGSNIYDQQEIWRMTTKGPQDMYAPFYAITVNKDGGKDIPFIEKIDASWSLSNPSQVELTVYEKRVIGCVYVMGGYFYFDRDGLVCDYSDKRLEFVPLVEGLDFSNIVLGKKLSVQKEKYFDVLLNLTLLLEASELEVDNIQILHDDAVVLNIGETEVKAGKRENYDIVVNALPRILSALENKNVVLKMENYSETNTTVVGSPKE